MTTKESEKKDYELSYLLKTEEVLRDVKKSVEQMGGTIMFEGPLQRIELSYPIAKEHHAHFGYVHISLLPEHASSLAKSLEMKEGVLRSMMITPPVAKHKERSQFPPRGTRRPTTPLREVKPEDTRLSNEELEKKIEEILK